MDQDAVFVSGMPGRRQFPGSCDWWHLPRSRDRYSRWKLSWSPRAKGNKNRKRHF
jgi:hypothetical protein